MDTVFSRLTKENTKEKIFILLFWQMKSPHTIYWVFIYLIYLISGNIYKKKKKKQPAVNEIWLCQKLKKTKMKTSEFNWENWKPQKKTI